MSELDIFWVVLRGGGSVWALDRRPIVPSHRKITVGEICIETQWTGTGRRTSPRIDTLYRGGVRVVKDRCLWVNN